VYLFEEALVCLSPVPFVAVLPERGLNCRQMNPGRPGCMPKHEDMVIALAVSDSQLKKRDPVKREAKQDLRSLSTQTDVRIQQPVKGFGAFR
jgi:hypothetical protein